MFATSNVDTPRNKLSITSVPLKSPTVAVLPNNVCASRALRTSVKSVTSESNAPITA